MGKKAVSKLFYLTSILLTLLLAAITIIAVYAPGVSPEKSQTMAFLALGTPVLLMLNVILFIYWAIRLRFWVWVPLIAIAFQWNFLIAIYQPPFGKEEQPAQSSDLTLATYNVTHFGKQYIAASVEQITAYMKNENVDIICFQEFGEYAGFTTDSISAALKDWPYNYIPYSKDANILRLAIYSKYPISQGELLVYPDTQNASMWCDVDVNGNKIRLFNNHFQTTNVTQSRKTYERKIQNTGLEQEAQFARNAAGLVYINETKRAEQADIIGKLVEESPYPVLLCGDFNSIPSSYTYHRMLDSGLQDGFKSAGKGYMYTFRYFKKALRIDYIFHSPSIQGIDYYSPDLDISSDHNPVIFSCKF